MTPAGRIWNALREYLPATAAALGLSLLLKAFVLDAVVVPTRSMGHTLLPGDFVFVNKLVYGAPLRVASAGLRLPALRPIRRGDVLVFRMPGGADGPPYVKRCIGVGGDWIELRNNVLRVNGDEIALPGDDFGPVRVPRKGDRIRLSPRSLPLYERLIASEGHTAEVGGDGMVTIDGEPRSSYEVGSDCLFVLGDNVQNSYDSRRWGFLPVENVVGAAMMVYWSVAPTGPAGDPAFLSRIRWDRIGTLVR